MERREQSRMDKKEVRQINTTALAYLGDAVYEVAIRKYNKLLENIGK